MKIKKNSFVYGTAILVATGLFSRMIGFYYRIFLSRSIGSIHLGIYQLALPVFSICIAITCSGIHTSISKYVAANTAKRESHYYLFSGLLISFLLCMLICIPLYSGADYIARQFLGELRCAPLVRILSMCVPLECIHSCINGYYYGLKKATVSAVGQCVEQLIRVGSVYAIYLILQNSNMKFTEVHAALGLVFGEAAAAFFSLTVASLSGKISHSFHQSLKKEFQEIWHAGGQLFSMAAPLTLNRISLSTLSSLETIFIPQRLMTYGYENSQALSVYGVFTGMALPLVFFPTVLSNSIAVLLLPSISKAQKENRRAYIDHAVSLSFIFSMTAGFAFTIAFFVFGNFIGTFLFDNEMAGSFIRTLSWICPFIFLNTTLSSILNGLGQTKITFGISMTGCLIRLLFVFFILPFYGMISYLIGLLLSYLVTSMISLYLLRRQSCTFSQI